MKLTTTRWSAAIFAACLLASQPARAVTINADVLRTLPSNSGSHTYSGFDAEGTTLQVVQASGASMNPNSGSWPGLWLGGQHDSDSYSFSFNKAVSFVEFYITAQSSMAGSFSEVFTAFTTSAPSTASFVSEAGTAWDGTNLTSSDGDGRSRIRFTSVGAAGFSSIAFTHLQMGTPFGSVFQEIQFSAAIPEPASSALWLAGLVVLGAVARRRS